MKKLALLIALAAVGSGCSILGLGDSVASELRGQRNAWLRQGIRDYTYEYHVACFCPPSDTLIIEVHNNMVTNITNKRTGLPVGLHVVYTIPQFYDFLIDAAEDADEMTVDFDKQLHVPTNVFIDYERNTADEELYVSASNLLVIESLQQARAVSPQTTLR